MVYSLYKLYIYIWLAYYIQGVKEVESRELLLIFIYVYI